MTTWRMFVVIGLILAAAAPAGAEPPTPRKPASDQELRLWLENMVWRHQYSVAEVAAATGLSAADVRAALAKFAIRPDNTPRRAADAPLL